MTTIKHEHEHRRHRNGNKFEIVAK